MVGTPACEIPPPLEARATTGIPEDDHIISTHVHVVPRQAVDDVVGCNDAASIHRHLGHGRVDIVEHGLAQCQPHRMSTSQRSTNEQTDATADRRLGTPPGQSTQRAGSGHPPGPSHAQRRHSLAHLCRDRLGPRESVGTSANDAGSHEPTFSVSTKRGLWMTQSRRVSRTSCLTELRHVTTMTHGYKDIRRANLANDLESELVVLVLALSKGPGLCMVSR